MTDVKTVLTSTTKRVYIRFGVGVKSEFYANQWEGATLSS